MTTTCDSMQALTSLALGCIRMSLFGDERPPVRCSAARAVASGRLSGQDKRAATEVRKLLDDQDQRVRQAAAEALKKILDAEHQK